MRTFRGHWSFCRAFAALLSVHLCALGEVRAGNVLLVIIDDVGVADLSAYGLPTVRPALPNIDRLATQGVVFSNAWAMPACAPTRAAIQTGCFPFRTRVGLPGQSLDESRTILPEVITAPAACIGKWGLGEQYGLMTPNVHGYEHYSGGLGSGVFDYYFWSRVINGQERRCFRYATSQQADDTVRWIRKQSGDWFCCLCFNAGHTPYHVPPRGLHGQSVSRVGYLERGRVPTADLTWEQRMAYYMASLEALDTELGRVIAQVDPRSTTMIVVSDNGPFGLNAQSPFDPIRSKGTVYEGGVWVPLIVAGRMVVEPGRRSSDLVNVVDLFATIVELMGGSQNTGVDSRSLVPILRDPAAPQVRQFNYCEQFTVDPSPLDMRAIRSPTLKLVQRRGARDELFDLSLDRFERRNVIGLSTYQSAAYELRGELLALTGSSSLNASDFVQGDEAPFLDEQSTGRTDLSDFETDLRKGAMPARSRSVEVPRSEAPTANRKR